MKFWLDAHVSPALVQWLREEFGVEAEAVRDLGLRDAGDDEIFDKARTPGLVVATKDEDFRRLVEKHGPPPQILWITCGNTSNSALKVLLAEVLPDALRHLRDGEPLVEVRGRL